eukprot:scaffold18205_cov29-Tisochrysis_lutea.AAC.2
MPIAGQPRGDAIHSSRPRWHDNSMWMRLSRSHCRPNEESSTFTNGSHRTPSVVRRAVMEHRNTGTQRLQRPSARVSRSPSRGPPPRAAALAALCRP